jgi:hypothetical protein
MAMALEMVRMTVASAREAEFLGARPTAIQAIRQAFPELRSARLFRGEEPGTWYDILFWDSLDAARRAAAQAAEIPAMAAWVAHIQEVQILKHGTLVHETTRGEA